MLKPSLLHGEDFFFFKSMSICIQQCQLATMIRWFRWPSLDAMTSHCMMRLSLVWHDETVWRASSSHTIRLQTVCVEQDGHGNWLWVDVIYITCGYRYLTSSKRARMWCLLIFHWNYTEITQRFQDSRVPLVESGAALYARSCMVKMVFFFMHPL